MKEVVKAVNQFLGTNLTFLRCKDPNLGELLLKYEKGNRIQEYKFGILYCKENQTDENDMFANSNNFPFPSPLLPSPKLNVLLLFPISLPPPLTGEESPEYKKFLEFIGNRIKLKGWKKFRGGLDVNGSLPFFFLIL